MRVSKSAVLPLIAIIFIPGLAQEYRSVITLESSIGFGACPASPLQIDAFGGVSLSIGPLTNRFEEHKWSITTQ